MLLAGAASAQTPCSGEPDGWRLRACLRAAHAPASLLVADDAFRALVETVDVRTRLDSTLVTDSTFVPADSTWSVESWWEVETVPYVLALDGTATVAPDAAAARAAGWTAHEAEPGAGPPAHAIGTPLAADALPAPADGHLDLLAALPPSSLQRPRPRRQRPRRRRPRRALRPHGLPAHVEAAGPWPASGAPPPPPSRRSSPSTRPTRPTTPSASATTRPPPSRATPTRSSSTRPSPIAPSHPARQATPPSHRPLWINEVHATNDGPDTGEGVEVAGPSGTDLLGYRLVLYGGHGEPYDPYDDAVPAAPVLAGALPSEGTLGAAWLPVRGIWNRCNGVALFDPDGRVSHFLSYGGCQFNALDGPVHDLATLDGAADVAHPDSLVWSEPTRGPSWRPVHEWTRMPAGYSLQLTGAGTRLADFAWGGPHLATPGRLGDYQAAGQLPVGPSTSRSASPRPRRTTDRIETQ